MSDKMPFWTHILRWLGWTVEQDWEVVKKDYQGCVRLWANGYPTKLSAQTYSNKTPGSWVRHSINVWRD